MGLAPARPLPSGPLLLDRVPKWGACRLEAGILLGGPLLAFCHLHNAELPMPSVDNASRLVLVSGVSGFLGSATALEFLERGWKGMQPAS